MICQRLLDESQSLSSKERLVNISKGPHGFAGVPGGPGRPGMPGTPGMPGGLDADFELPEADVSHVRRKWLDVPYAHTSPAQQLDLFLPDTGEGPFPIVLHIHGGAFAIGDKRDLQVLSFLRGLDRGYAVASVNYRLSGEAIFPAGLQDVKAAIRWLRAHEGGYALDASRIAVCGCSAGGNLAAMVCVTSGVSMFDDAGLGNAQYPCDVGATVDMFGPTDFLKMDAQLAANGLGPSDHNQADSPESRYLGAPITEIQDRVRLANPTTYIHAGMSPILIQHGRLDSNVPVQQSIAFARAIEEQVGPNRFELDILENAGHADPVFETHENMTRVFEFLDRHLG
jgi:acetyl esterase/lipase